MVTEDYVSLETAKLLKEKGFDEATNRYYNAQYDQIRTVSDTFMWHWNDEEFMKRVLMEGAIAIPTLQMAMKWLREKYNIHIEPRYFPTPNIYRYVIIRSKATFENIDSHPQYFNTNEEACEAGIRYALENLI